MLSNPLANRRAASFHRVILISIFAAMHAEYVFAQQGPALVTIAPVSRQTVSAEISFVATVTPLRRSVVGTAVDGRVVEFLGSAQDNQSKLTRVSKGQPLAKLRTQTIDIELLIAQAELNLRQEQLAELRNGARPEERSAAEAKQKSAEARMEYARAKYDRAKLLFDRGQAVTREQLDLTLAEAVEAQMGFRESKAQNDLVIAGPRPEQVAQAASRVRSQQETIKRLQDIILKYEIRAPFDGYVVAEHTEVGAWLTKGDPVAEVIQLNVVELETFVPEKYISAIRLGMEVPLAIDAFASRSFIGTAKRIIPQADVSHTFPVKIQLENPKHANGHLLKAGMLGRAKLSVGEPGEVLLVPKDALVLDRARPRVFVVDEFKESTTTVQSVEVTLGVADGDLIQVSGDIREGQYVATQGNERLRDGQTVRITRQ